MGLFEKIFPRKDRRDYRDSYFRLLNGYTPVFRSRDGELYESELVRSCIDARARHISKLKVEINGAAKPKLRNILTKAPNSWQTWSQFLYRTSTILDARNTAFIVPVENGTETEGIYTILPRAWELTEYMGTPFIRFAFDRDKTSAIELSKVGILTKFQYKSDLFGSTNGALHETMDLINIQNQGIQEGIKSAASFRFMATMTNFADDEDLVKERKRFAENNLRESEGFLLWPNTYKDIKQIDSKPFVIDDKQMELIKTNAFEYFGVNEDVLQNKAYGDAWSAFYEGGIEPFAIQFSDVVTRMLFTHREQTEGNQVMATSNRLQYMTTQDKLNVSAQLADRGILNRDEVRDIWSLPPLPNGEGQEYIIRGEYYNASEKITEEGESDEQ